MDLIHAVGVGDGMEPTTIITEIPLLLFNALRQHFAGNPCRD